MHAVRMTTASVASFVTAYLLGLPEGLYAAITAIVVTQSNVGGSLKTAFDQLVGSLCGAVYAAAIAFLIRPDDLASSAAALAIALAPLTVMAARSAGFRVAPITAAIVLLGGAGLHLSPTDLAVLRVASVVLGCVIGLLVAILIGLPNRERGRRTDRAPHG